MFFLDIFPTDLSRLLLYLVHTVDNHISIFLFVFLRQRSSSQSIRLTSGDRSSIPYLYTLHNRVRF